MRNLQHLLKKRSNRYILVITLALALLFLLFRINVLSAEPILPVLDSIYKAYLLIPEWIANQVFMMTETPVTIINHELVYSEHTVFHTGYEKFILDWPKYLLYKRWCILIPVMIWMAASPVRKKIISSLAFLLVHMVSVVGGLYLMGVVYPGMFHDQISVPLSPTLAGNLLLYSFLAVWILLSKEELRSSIRKFGINYHLADRKIYELIIVLLLFLVLREFMIPYFRYRPYVILLLNITGHISSWFGHTGYISGDRLVGEFGTLGLAKHCLGFMSFYLFSSFVFLTREKLPDRITIIFVTAGLILLNILNIIRLAAIFIIVQGVNGTERASLHHEIYNVVIYIFIFAMWILWYERFVRRSNKPVTTK